MRSDDADSPRPPSPRWKIGLALVAVASVAGVIFWAVSRPKASSATSERAAPPDPRLSYQGPFRNVHPYVGYVGDGRCVECHAEIHRTYSRHPMGRSVVPVAEVAGDLPTDAAHGNPFEAFDILFRVDRRGRRVWHRQTRLDAGGAPVYDFAHEADFVIGAGGRGHSYLTARDGFVFQTPISWFARTQKWGLSPGFPPWARAGRLVPAACLNCHANRVEPVEHTRNRFREPVFRGHAIGCERCHGPGERHAQTSDRDDIANPRRLEPALREAVCEQCHLEGAARVLRAGRSFDDFRPGMPLQDFFTVFVRGAGADGETRAVNHVEQMHQSRCFRRSTAANKMGCITCHDPHEAVAPERRVAHYRERCLSCHTTSGCGVPEEARRKKHPDDSCIACHMPSSANADIVHTASTDHRIPRKPGEQPAGRPGKPPLLVDFYRGIPDLDDRGVARDVALAIYQLTLEGQPLTEADGEFAVRSLGESLADWPGDLDAWEARGKLLQIMRRSVAALDAFEALLARAPRHEGALVTLGALSRELGRKESAIDYWRRAVEVNPWVAEYQRNLAVLLADKNAWDECRPHCRAWLDLDPASVVARQTWVRCLLAAGQKAEAGAEFAKIRALQPADLGRLEAWFAKQMP